MKMQYNKYVLEVHTNGEANKKLNRISQTNYFKQVKVILLISL